ncbi:MAG: glycosyltransferase family 4 protein [Cyanobacteria bacterium J06621_8]
MKPIVWHLIGDKGKGGSNLLVRQLITSSLAQQFDFAVWRIEEAKVQLKKNVPNVIIFHYACAWKHLADLWFLKQRCPVYIYDHHYSQGFEQHQVSSPCRFHLMLRLAYGLADGIVSISNAQRDWILSHKLVNPNKIRIIYSASPVASFLAIPPKSSGNPLKIGAYGRFVSQKGFDLLLSAFASLPGEKFQLYLGGYGQNESSIKNLAQDFPHVKLLGAIEDVPKFLADCDAIAIPSRWEPWGLVCLESKAAGKPVIVFAVDGLREQVILEAEDSQSNEFQVGDYGIIVPPQNVGQLTKAIASLPQTNLKALGEAGRASVANAWSEFLHSWSVFLGEVIG